MISVFGAFVLGDDVNGKMFGIGLSVAVFLDATLVRMVLVPATMSLARPRQLVAAELARPHPSAPRPRGRQHRRRRRRRRHRARARARRRLSRPPAVAVATRRRPPGHSTAFTTKEQFQWPCPPPIPSSSTSPPTRSIARWRPLVQWLLAIPHLAIVVRAHLAAAPADRDQLRHRAVHEADPPPGVRHDRDDVPVRVAVGELRAVRCTITTRRSTSSRAPNDDGEMPHTDGDLHLPRRDVAVEAAVQVAARRAPLRRDDRVVDRVDRSSILFGLAAVVDHRSLPDVVPGLPRRRLPLRSASAGLRRTAHRQYPPFAVRS